MASRLVHELALDVHEGEGPADGIEHDQGAYAHLGAHKGDEVPAASFHLFPGLIAWRRGNTGCPSHTSTCCWGALPLKFVGHFNLSWII